MAAAVALAAAPLPTGLWAAPSPSSTGTAPGAPAATGLPAPAASGSLQLKVRRLPDSLELVLEGVGPGPQLQQSFQDGQWQGLLRTIRPLTIRQGAQRLALPELGVEAVSLSGAGQNFQLQLQPVKGFPVMRPVVSADGSNLILTFPAAPQQSLQVGRFDLTRPTLLPQPAPAPPLQPRAVAPPLGDMAVGSMMLRNRGYVNLSGPPVTMTLKNVAAKDVLMSLAQLGGYGFVWVENSDPSESTFRSVGTGASQESSLTKKEPLKAQPVSASFVQEPYGRAFNSIVMAAGLQANRDGNTIYVGIRVLAKTLGPQLSKIYRLNQVSADGASQYLASLGAVINVPNVTTQTSSSGTSTNTGAGASSGGSTASNTSSSSSTSTYIQSYGSATGPLQGLIGTIDGRLSTITLVGDPSVVAIAEQYLRQLDLRQRQVALSVKILDVTLDNDTSIENSFAFRYGNNFIVNNRGELQGAFGGLLPPRGDQFDVLSGGASSAKTVTTTLDSGSSLITLQPNSPAPVNPGNAYPSNNFFDLVQASIQSRNTKLLASPTLILTDNPQQLRDGSDRGLIGQGLGGSGGGGDSGGLIGRSKANEALVTVGEQVVTNWTVTAGQNGAPNSCQAQLSTAGLTFGARVQKIDDNGFVTFSITPTITAPTRTETVPQCGKIEILAVRSLDSGSARVRDGQTLIMTGVLSDLDNQTVQKWPILGDLPLVGQFFRSTGGLRRKRELVILVTPRILHDDQGGTYGYGYQPLTPDARSLMQPGG